MENISSNSSQESAAHLPTFALKWFYLFTSLIDILPFLVGQPVIAKLLWLYFTSKKAADILNLNLALFHNLQYFISIVHLHIMFLLPKAQNNVLQFLFGYAQIGGPLNLCFICLERYVAVIHPISFPVLKRYRFKEISAVVVWLFSVPIALINVLASEIILALKDAMMTFRSSLLLAVTLVTLYCNIIIVLALKKKLHPVKRRAFKIIFSTFDIVLFCYGPVTILQMLDLSEENYNFVIIPICISFLATASVMHPLLYLYSQGKSCICLKRDKKAS